MCLNNVNFRRAVVWFLEALGDKLCPRRVTDMMFETDNGQGASESYGHYFQKHLETH